MKGGGLALAIAGLALAWSPQAEPPHVLIVTGDSDGYLSPCGCTKPMTGGIRRRVEAAKSLSAPGRTTLVDSGALSGASGRQEELKAETAAEILGASGWDAINLAPSDARLGPGTVLAMQRLSGGKMLSSVLERSESNELPQTALHGPFFILGAAESPEAIARPLGERALPLESALTNWAPGASAAGLAPILLLHGGRESAERVAASVPSIQLIVYRSEGEPRADKQGSTWFATTGSDGKHLLRFEFASGQFSEPRVVDLTPEFRDDPTAARLYRAYLDRVEDEGLLETIRRQPTKEFAGSKVCGSCHGKSSAVWKASEHALALETLEADGHDVDPECMPCHVVGLTSDKGFRSREQTPLLAGVGCESCHGPSRAHAKQPNKFRLPTVGEKPCMECHTPETSPGFEFAAYWQHVRHP